MTEEEWLRDDRLIAQIHYANLQKWDRKLRLFASACARQHWHVLPSQSDAHRSIEASELLADALIDASDVRRIHRKAQKSFLDNSSPDLPTIDALAIAALCCSENTFTAASQTCKLCNPRSKNQSLQFQLFRDIFANPYRPVIADPAWLTPTVQAIAAAIYADRAFDRLPILADSLEEAGCTNADVLLHCRRPGEHVRGCWVVDLVLGKE